MTPPPNAQKPRRFRRVLLWSLAALVVAFIVVESIYNYHHYCKDSNGVWSVSGCVALTDVVMVAGGLVVGTTYLANLIMPRTSVLVELPDGAQLHGKLSHMAVSGRSLPSGKPVKLDCRVSKTNATDYQYGSCQLEFPDRPPRPKAIDYFERTGKQPGWTFGINEQGETYPDMMVLERPLRWVDGQGR